MAPVTSGLGATALAYPRSVAVDQENRDELLKDAVRKVAIIVVAVALAVGIGSWVLVKGLGLDETNTGGPGSTVEPVKPLPSTALPVPSESIPGATDSPETPTPGQGDGSLQLSASPLTVSPMGRINLTGSWAGQDNVSLAVQRLEGGAWTDFGVQVPVRIGTFETYVMTGRTGANQFRVFDPSTQTASNPVTVTVQ